MTRQRNDEHGTEFGNWLRKQPNIDSKLGYVATNIDYMWENYKSGEWMLIEEKRHCTSIRYAQRKQFDKIDRVCRSDPMYRGFHIIIFEHTSPDDGRIWLDGNLVTKSQLLAFLRFEN